MHLDDYICVLCNNGTEETSFHLCFECPFSTACWNTIPIQWNLSLPHLDMVIEARSNFGSNLFREICITACWVIWITRNAVIFDNGQISVNAWKKNSRKSWVWCASRPNIAEEVPSLCGKRISLYESVFFFWVCRPCFFALLLFLPCFLVVQSILSFNIKRKK